MKLHFSIRYKTVWGQRLRVTGNHPLLGNGDYQSALSLNFNFPDEWSGFVEVTEDEIAHLSYHYLVLNEGAGTYTEEWETGRTIALPNKPVAHLFCVDQWNAPGDLSTVFLTAPFKKVLLRDGHASVLPQFPAKYTHVFKVKAPVLDPRQVVCIIGDCGLFGNWTTQKPLQLQKYGDEWLLGRRSAL